MSVPARDIAAAFRAACRDELEAPKPGNVHLFADGHRMSAPQFMRSAEVAAGPLVRAGTRVGRRILDAVEATFAAVGVNTNLGIILLAAPIAAAAEDRGGELRPALSKVLERLDVEDAGLAFRAIARASPGGLGRVDRHDVFAPATVTLKAAMAEAADRDRIARQYVSDFADVFETGMPILVAALARWRERPWATLALHLGFLSQFPDTHVVRNRGMAAGEEVRSTAIVFAERLDAKGHSPAFLSDILAWDADLKGRGINPGTAADLTVGTLFAHYLMNYLPSRPNSD